MTSRILEPANGPVGVELLTTSFLRRKGQPDTLSAGMRPSFSPNRREFLGAGLAAFAALPAGSLALVSSSREFVRERFGR